MNLKTVAVYNDPTQAQIARNMLAQAGVWATIADAEIVAMDLLLSSAVGGVKVQVRESDADHAAEVLTEVYGNASGIVTEEVDLDELTRQALEAAPDEQEEEPPVEAPALEPAESPPVATVPSERAEYAKRFFLASIFSCLFMPLAFYAIYLGLNATFGEGRLTAVGRNYLLLGMILLIGILPLIAVLLYSWGFNTYTLPQLW